MEILLGKFSTTLLLGLLLSFTACAPAIQPVVKDGRYINPQYEYALDIPEGWELSDKVPDWLAANLTSAQASAIKTVLVNEESQGIISVFVFKVAGKFSPRGNGFSKGYTDGLIKGITRSFEKKKKIAVKDTSFKSYDYDVYSVDQCGDPCFVLGYSSVYDITVSAVQDVGRIYLGKCKKDDTCIVQLGLTSNLSSFAENSKPYLETIHSLEMGQSVMRDYEQEEHSSSAKRQAAKGLQLQDIQSKSDFDGTVYKSMFSFGVTSYNNRDYETALKLWLSLAEAGHPESAFRIADMYDFGQGVPQNYKQAARWYLAAADRGHGEAQCRIAGRYDDGLGVSRDIEEAYKWYWLCAHSEEPSERAKYHADISMRSMHSVGVLSMDQINNAEELAESWEPRPSLRF